ncbi:hypothetical protein B296_00051463 [Ensete ventricosum]|uniref:Uncharacterized protein n=1 Tax=Ensete ventricosum TaxID=4639 RepID=A0A426XB22_ENSVE|nr:hypothetical protein B296_00051463 [Ensete ventricosum]
MLCLLHCVQWIRTTEFEPRAREAFHAGDPRSTSVDAPIVTLMRVFLTSLSYSCKTIPSGWQVPREVLPMIKLGLIQGVLMRPYSDCTIFDTVRPQICLSVCDTSLVCVKRRVQKIGHPTPSFHVD